MYEAHYGLTEKPFSIQPDPDFLYLGKQHSLAFSMLEYGVHNRAGFTVITGEVGSGKTTLIQNLLNTLDEDVTVGLISNTHPDIADLLQWIMMAFEQPYEGMSYVALYDAFQKFLIAEYQNNRRVILIVDEAQNLTAKSLEALRMLSNINAEKHQLLQLILVGQPELKDLLRKPELCQFAQRVAVDFHLRPLTVIEVKAYIIHRLKVAGFDRKLFTDFAIKLIADYSKGIPRTINILCDTALVYAMTNEATYVDIGIIEEVIRDKNEFGVFNYTNPNLDEKTD